MEKKKTDGLGKERKEKRKGKLVHEGLTDTAGGRKGGREEARRDGD